MSDAKTEAAREAKRLERERESALRQRHYRGVSKSDYIELSGRQTKVLHEQAARYGLPLTGKTVDLYAVLRTFHDLLAKWKHILPAAGEEIDLAGPQSDNLERFRLIRAMREELAYQQDLGEWVRKSDVDASLAAFAHVMRTACETLQRNFGPDPHALIDSALVDAFREVQILLGTDTGGPLDSPAESP